MSRKKTMESIEKLIETMFPNRETMQKFTLNKEEVFLVKREDGVFSLTLPNSYKKEVESLGILGKHFEQLDEKQLLWIRSILIKMI